MRLLWIWLLGVPAMVVSMVIVSQAVSCQKSHASLNNPSNSRCLVPVAFQLRR